jgi:hypothetical protein
VRVAHTVVLGRPEAEIALGRVRRIIRGGLISLWLYKENKLQA